MTREDKLRNRQARVIDESYAPRNDFQERDALIAQLYTHPGWEALKSQMQAMAAFHVPSPDDPQFDIKAHAMMFRGQFVVEVIKIVNACYARVHPGVPTT